MVFFAQANAARSPSSSSNDQLAKLRKIVVKASENFSTNLVSAHSGAPPQQERQRRNTVDGGNTAKWSEPRLQEDRRSATSWLPLASLPQETAQEFTSAGAAEKTAGFDSCGFLEFQGLSFYSFSAGSKRVCRSRRPATVKPLSQPFRILVMSADSSLRAEIVDAGSHAKRGVDGASCEVFLYSFGSHHGALVVFDLLSWDEGFRAVYLIPQAPFWC